MVDIPDLPPVLERLLEGGEHDAVGAYALDALPAAEREGYELHLSGCPQCQSELALLRLSADILRRALVPNGSQSERTTFAATAPAVAVEPAPPVTHVETQEAKAGEEPPTPREPLSPAAAPSFEAPPLPEADFPDAVALDDTPAIDNEADELAVEPATEPAAEPTGEDAVSTLPRKTRPRGRIAPGLQPFAGELVAAAPVRSSRLPWVVAALGVAIGIVAVLAALALAEMKGNLEDEIDFQNSQIAGLNSQRDTYLEQTSAITWTLEPTTLGAPNSTAIVYADPSGASAILSVTGMNPLGSDQAYQVFYLPEGSEPAPEPGPVFTFDSTGGAVVQITPDISTYQSLAITTEPAGGSELPTTDPVIQGFVSVQ
ncbi:hypothetical protein BH24CHL4_BH24CHL4_08170 [soil metagenome]